MTLANHHPSSSKQNLPETKQYGKELQSSFGHGRMEFEDVRAPTHAGIT
jgi:hypothetical protein